MTATAGRKGHRWRQARAQCIREEHLCVRCGRPVDKTLSGRHRDGPSADHWPHTLAQLKAMGIDPNQRDTLRLAHTGCNSGARDRGAQHPGRIPGQRARARRGQHGWGTPVRVVEVHRDF